jgi:hypothetical protein
MAPMMIISDGSLAILKSRGEATELIDGVRKISNVSYMSRDSVDSQATVEIPDEIDSIKTLEFLELNAETAAVVYDKFLALKAEYPDTDILRFAKRHVRSVAGDAHLLADDWSGVMQRIGLTSNYQLRVLSPNWVHMRVNSTAKETAIWMMEMRYEFLQALDNFIESPAKGLGRKVSHLDLSGRLQPGTPAIPPRSDSKGKGQPSSGIFEAGPSISTKAREPPSELLGCQLFYKGGSVARLEKLNNPDGTLSLQRLVSTPPTDFSARTAGLYLTKQEKVAFEYAGWAKQVVDGNVVPVGIMCIAIPDVLLSSHTQVFGDQWRELVWCCRHEDFPPDYLSDLTTTYQWIVGPVCHQSNAVVLKMTNSSELVIWKLDRGETASQHYTSSTQMLQLLNSSCVGKVWITNLAREEK